jgi:tRNA threonylcarbamoyladenosine biosynthesis protein TsaB
MPRLCLAFDTSSSLTAVALLEDGKLLAQEAEPSQDKHAQTLLPRIQICLSRAGRALADVDLFAVGIGPGSFTGVRVGLATAKGFVLATQKPLRGVVSLAALSRAALAHLNAPTSAPLIAPVLDAFKGEVFAALYEPTADGALRSLAEPWNAEPEAAATRLKELAAGRPLYILGSGCRRYTEAMQLLLGDHTALPTELDAPDAYHVGLQALHDLAHEGPHDPARLLPLYVRDSDAQLPKTTLRL